MSFSDSSIATSYGKNPSTGSISLGGGVERLPTRAASFHSKVASRIRRLRSIQGRLSLYSQAQTDPREGDLISTASPAGAEVFVVHGHNETLKLKVSSTVESLTGRRPRILHDEPNGGRTIIEKFEAVAGEVGFAVVLLTADDIGGPKSSDQRQERARQNVVFEMGYFIGRLGRDHVAVLYECNVELPSDMDGVLYTELDVNDAWRLSLARELRQAGYEVDSNNLL